MPIFRDLEGNFYDIPFDVLSQYQVKGELPEGTKLEGSQVEQTQDQTADYTWNVVPPERGATYTWPPFEGKGYTWNVAPPGSGVAPGGANYTWPPAPGQDYTWNVAPPGPGFGPGGTGYTWPPAPGPDYTWNIAQPV